MASMYSRKYFEEKVENGAYKKHETNVKNIEIFYNLEQLRAHIFYGRKQRPTTRFANSVEQLMFYIDSEIKYQYDKNKEKNEQSKRNKQMAEEARKGVQVGDIFNTSWGYDRTIVDFFEVVERVSSAYVKIRQIKSETVQGSEAFGSSRIKPVKGSYISEPRKCQIDKYGHIVKADEYGHNAYKSDSEKSFYISQD